MFVLYSSVLFCIWIVGRQIRRHIALRHIPAAGHGGILSSYLSGLRFTFDAQSVLDEGYKKYKGRIFKVALMDRWVVVATGADLVENLRAAPEHVLSMEAAIAELLQADYIFGKEIQRDAYHLGVVRGAMNKNMGVIMPLIIDEMILAINTLIPSTETWRPIQAVDTFSNIICRSANRAFIGLPLCRNEEYCAINIRFNKYVIFGAAFIGLFPAFLAPLVAACWNRFYRIHESLLPILKPVVDERRRALQEYGPSYPDKSNDMLSWILEASPTPDQPVEVLALRMLSVNFMTLHSTSLTLVHALYHLAAEPQYIDILREEIHTNFGPKLDRAQDWDREKLEKCWKLDSFLKESQRMNGLVALTLTRKTIVPFCFADGTDVPPGFIIAATPTATHYDETIYPEPRIFDGLRFSNIREKLNNAGQSNKLDEGKVCFTNTGHNYLSFGGGRHACPGRFLAALMMKSVIVHLILNYDMKLEKEGQRPANKWMGPMCFPSRKANILFRQRSS